MGLWNTTKNQSENLIVMFLHMNLQIDIQTPLLRWTRRNRRTYRYSDNVYNIRGVVTSHTVINNFNSYPQQLQFIPNFDVRLSQFIPNKISKSELHNSYHLNKRQKAQFIPYENFRHHQAQFIPSNFEMIFYCLIILDN